MINNYELEKIITFKTHSGITKAILNEMFFEDLTKEEVYAKYNELFKEFEMYIRNVYKRKYKISALCVKCSDGIARF